jgi:predicted dehydrogenase
LKVLGGDRVVEVVGMTTESPSQENPKIPMPDIQVALMKTAKGTILRLAVTFRLPGPEIDSRLHWYHFKGTKGYVEWSRGDQDKPKMWIANREMHQPASVDWRFERPHAPLEAKGTGHGDADYYVHASFRDAVLHGKKPELDVYGAMETAAPAILAADSIAQGSKLIRVPDFRPGPHRKPGQVSES